MFPTTQPMTGPDHWPLQPKVQQAQRRPAAASVRPSVSSDTGYTALTSLSPSLMQDLMRFEAGEGQQQRELLEVLAACIRHTQPLAIDLVWGRQPGVLTVFPIDRLVHCSVPLEDLLATDLATVEVLQVQPAKLRPPGSAKAGRSAAASSFASLGNLLWEVALRGARQDLLPELAGQAAYRVAPGVSFTGLHVPGAMATCITHLRRQTCNLREIAEWHQIGRDRAMRMLNALYLQSGLIVSRTHPAATNESWSGYEK
jgi:hypothetical protein